MFRKSYRISIETNRKGEDRFVIDKKDWLLGWVSYDNLSFRDYEKAVEHLQNIRSGYNSKK